MSFVCIVCRDSLTSAPRADQEEAAGPGEHHIVVTKCGHLYHRSCLQDWFNHNQRTPIQKCPLCLNVVQTNDLQRIFPTGDEDTEEINTLQNAAKTSKQESEGLKREMNQLEIILEETATKLEEINLAHDLLSFEVAEKSSELESLKKEMEDEKNMNDAIKHNLETLLQTAQKDKLVLENKLMGTENQLKLQQQQAETDRQRRNRDDRLNDCGPQNYGRLFNELKNLQEHLASSLTLRPTVTKKPSKSTAFQTEGLGISESDPFHDLSRTDIYKLCIEFLEKERTMTENPPITKNRDVEDYTDRGIENSIVSTAPSNTHTNGTIRSLTPVMTFRSPINMEQMCTVNQVQGNGMNSYYDQMEKSCNSQPVLRLDSPIGAVENETTNEPLSWEAARLERQRQYYCRINSDKGIEAD